jgi:hypothetical protein
MDPTQPTVAEYKFPKFADLKAELTRVREIARKDCRKNWEFRCIRDRGRRILVIAKGDRLTDPWDWDGTFREITQLVAKYGDRAEKIVIDGGFDGADSLQEFKDFDYQPEIEMYEVTVWEKVPACKHCGLPGASVDGYCTELHRSEAERIRSFYEAAKAFGPFAQMGTLPEDDYHFPIRVGEPFWPDHCVLKGQNPETAFFRPVASDAEINPLLSGKTIVVIDPQCDFCLPDKEVK